MNPSGITADWDAAAGALEVSPLRPVREGFAYVFRAMACPCEVRVATDDAALATRLGAAVHAEAQRIEGKFSRYRPDSQVGRINAAAGQPVTVDAETAQLLDYADHCHRLSEGRFDITSGVLRRVWTFDRSDRIPTPEAVNAMLPFVGWDKVVWRSPQITLARGMEVDFGGFGKEYAVDLALRLALNLTEAPLLVNFGGDLAVSGPRAGGTAWSVALDAAEAQTRTTGRFELASGALATSGDAHRYLVRDGVRYSHILDPRTGWPVEDPPRSVTVAAPTCSEAGLVSTLAMLHGQAAEDFLDREGVKAWVIR